MPERHPIGFVSDCLAKYRDGLRDRQISLLKFSRVNRPTKFVDSVFDNELNKATCIFLACGRNHIRINPPTKFGFSELIPDDPSANSFVADR